MGAFVSAGAGLKTQRFHLKKNTPLGSGRVNKRIPVHTPALRKLYDMSLVFPIVYRHNYKGRIIPNGYVSGIVVESEL